MNEIIQVVAVLLVVANVVGLIFWLGRRSSPNKVRLDAAADGLRAGPAPVPDTEGGTIEAARDWEDTRLCGDCSYWDLEEGQSVMRQHPEFMLASAHLPPAVIGAVIQFDPCPDCPAGIDPPEIPPPPDDPAYKGCDTCRGSGLKRIGPKPTGMPMKASWEEFGACLCEKTFDDNGDGGITWKEDTCEYWRGKTHLKVVAS